MRGCGMEVSAYKLARAMRLAHYFILFNEGLAMTWINIDLITNTFGKGLCNAIHRG